MPRTIKGEARAEWNRIVPELEQIGLIALVDRAILIRYCTAWANWYELDERLTATGLLVQGRHSGVVRNPLWMMRSDAEAVLHALGCQLGLTPAARLRAGVKHETPDEEEDSVGPTAIDDYKRRLGV